MSSSDSTTAVSALKPRKGRRYFSLADANRALGYVSRVVDDLMVAYQNAIVTRQRIEHPHPGDVADDLHREYENLMDRLNELVDELAVVGVELKDFETGLVDFPALHNGREVCLCWKRGEKSITAWHEVEAGFAGRQDVSLLEQ